MLNGHNIIPSSLTDEEHQLIQHQLKKILASNDFKSAKQIQRFLTFIVNKTASGDGKLLKQYTIGVEALSFRNDFDPESNPAVRIMAGRVRNRLNEYYNGSGCNDEMVISIPKGSYIPQFVINTRVKRNSDTSSETSRGPKLALVSFSDKTQLDNSNRLLIQITDNMAKELSRFLYSHVIVCNPYADKSQSHLAETKFESECSADYILALYMQQLPQNKFELLYRLKNVDSGQILWSESFAIKPDSDSAKIEKIIGIITVTVADLYQGIMQTHWARDLLDNEHAIPNCHQVLAYNRSYLDNLGRDAFAKATASCLEALKRNSNDVIANVIYAEYCRREYVFGYGVIENPLKSGIHYAEKAVRLEPNSHVAHYALGQILFYLKEWDRSIDELNLARSISKYYTYIEYGVGLICLMNKWDKGIDVVKNAISISSTYPSWFHVAIFLDFYRRKKYKGALSEANKITAPSIVYGPLARCVVNAQLGELHIARQELQEVLRRFPYFMEKGEQYMSRFLGSEALTENVWDGVLKTVNSIK